MIIYLVDTTSCKIAYDEAEKAVEVAIDRLEKEIKHKKKAERQIFSDYDGLHIMRVSQFDESAVTAYLKAMKVHRKVILQVTDTIEATTSEVTLHKILLETESTCRKTYQDHNSKLVLTESQW